MDGQVFSPNDPGVPYSVKLRGPLKMPCVPLRWIIASLYTERRSLWLVFKRCFQAFKHGFEMGWMSLPAFGRLQHRQWVS